MVKYLFVGHMIRNVQFYATPIYGLRVGRIDIDVIADKNVLPLELPCFNMYNSPPLYDTPPLHLSADFFEK